MLIDVAHDDVEAKSLKYLGLGLVTYSPRLRHSGLGRCQDIGLDYEAEARNLESRPSRGLNFGLEAKRNRQCFLLLMFRIAPEGSVLPSKSGFGINNFCLLTRPFTMYNDRPYARDTPNIC